MYCVPSDFCMFLLLGGGSSDKRTDTLTEAVMDVLGKESVYVVSASWTSLDTTFLSIWANRDRQEQVFKKNLDLIAIKKQELSIRQLTLLFSCKYSYAYSKCLSDNMLNSSQFQLSDSGINNKWKFKMICGELQNLVYNLLMLKI